MEWIKKNKVLVSIVGVGVVILGIIIAVMVAVPRNNAVDDADENLNKDLPSNLQWDISRELTEGTVGKAVEIEGVNWGKDLGIEFSTNTCDFVLNEVTNTVIDDDALADRSFVSVGYDYVVVDFTVTPTVDDMKYLPRIISDSDQFVTTSTGDYIVYYIDNRLRENDSDDTDDAVDWSYLDYDVGYKFVKGDSYHVVGVWRMLVASGVTADSMVDGFSFTMSDSMDDTTYHFEVPRDPAIVAEEEALLAQADLLDEYMARAYTCVPSSYYQGFENAETEEIVGTARIMCALAERDGVDLGFEWNDPDYYTSLLGDMSEYDFSVWDDFDLDTYPEGMFDESGEPTELYKTRFAEEMGRDFDDYVAEQNASYEEQVAAALEEWYKEHPEDRPDE